VRWEDEGPAVSMSFPPRFAHFPFFVFRLQHMVLHPSTFILTVVKSCILKLQLIRRKKRT
jgi:hypothetical protein